MDTDTSEHLEASHKSMGKEDRLTGAVQQQIERAMLFSTLCMANRYDIIRITLSNILHLIYSWRMENARALSHIIKRMALCIDFARTTPFWQLEDTGEHISAVLRPILAREMAWQW